MPAEGIYRIRSGKVKVVEQRGDREHIIALLGAGDYIGVEALFEGAFYKVSAYALEDVSAYFLTREQVNELIRRRPQLYDELLDVLTSIVSRVEREDEEILVTGSTTERLAEVLLGLLEKFGENEQGYLDIRISQSDLADLAHISRQTLYRILNRWKQQGWIRMSGSHLQITCRECLERLQEKESGLVLV